MFILSVSYASPRSSSYIQMCIESRSFAGFEKCPINEAIGSRCTACHLSMVGVFTNSWRFGVFSDTVPRVIVLQDKCVCSPRYEADQQSLARVKGLNGKTNTRLAWPLCISRLSEAPNQWQLTAS